MSLRFISALLILWVAVGLNEPAKVKKPLVGTSAPELKLEKLLQAPKGAKTDWADLKGQVVVLEFWATWCGPCVAAIPHLNKLAEEFKDKPVRFISVTDEKESIIKKFLKKKAMRSWIGLDTDKSTHKAYGIRGIPATFLLDKHGKIAGIAYPSDVTTEVLNELLEGKPLSVLSMDQVNNMAVTAGVAPGGEKKPVLFEISIRPAVKIEGSQVWGHGNLTATGSKLRSLVSLAYGVSATRIVEKDPLGETAYDVVVAMPKGRHEMFNPLLQQALELTFGIKAQREKRETDVFLLTTNGGENGRGLQPTASTGGSSMHSDARGFEVVGMPISSLASQLESLFERPVLDQTHLSGQFDWELKLKDTESQTLIDAVRKQLGLRLVPGKETVEMLVVGKIDK